MSLSIMTPEWTELINEITIFILRERIADDEKMQEMGKRPMDVFNDWARKRGIAVTNTETALWCVSYIRDIIEMPLHRLKKAAEIDGLEY